MLKPTSANRGMALETSVGEDVLLLETMKGEEFLSRPFEYAVTALSLDKAVDGKKLLGQNATIRMVTFDKSDRYFNGFVTAFSQLPPSSENFARYQLVLRPWLWLLTRASNSRIFQNMNVPDIVKQVFDDHGLTDYKFELDATYREWEYCVQYQETDFNFVSRLLEQEGIYYFFEHENGKHVAHFVDESGKHEEIPAYKEVPFYVPNPEITRDRDHIYEWVLKQEVQPGKYATNSFDFKAPSKNLEAVHTIEQEHDASSFEIFDYSGEYTTPGDGKHYADVRMQELASGFELIDGAGDARGLASGYTFSLVNFDRTDQNRKYLMLGMVHQLRVGGYEADEDSVEEYDCTFTAMDAETQYRTPRLTPKPEIRGPQTAVVVGPSGEEIHTDGDGHGIIKVKFHWDRFAKADDTASCWIRVSQLSAGQNWGSIMLPRVGQEVIVQYLNGDPDRPIVTGRVYNGENKPPYKLPDNKTMSGTKTNTSKGGGGFNEIRFEDKASEEQIFIHGQKNLDVNVLNDRFEKIGNDRHLIVGNDKLEEVQNDRDETVEGHHKEKITKERHLTIGGLSSVKISKGSTFEVKEDAAENYGKNYSMVVVDDMYVKAKNIVLEADTNITIEAGGSYIAMQSSGIKIATSGDVEIEGNNITEKAQMDMTLDAALNMTITGLSVAMDGSAMVEIGSPMTTVGGDGMLTLKGGMVMIN